MIRGWHEDEPSDGDEPSVEVQMLKSFDILSASVATISPPGQDTEKKASLFLDHFLTKVMCKLVPDITEHRESLLI